MLTWTFCHMKGIGVGAEADLWARSALTWADLEREAASLLFACQGQICARRDGHEQGGFGRQ